MEIEEKETTTPVSSPVQTQDFLETHQPQKRNIWPPVLIIVVLLGLVGGTLVFIKGRTQESFPTPTPLTIATVAPTPTLTPLSKEEIKIKVFNGTGIAGEAAFLKEKLASLGYTSVEVGNAQTEDNKSVKISLGSAVPEEAKTEITVLLEDVYSSVEETSALPAGVDIEITTGLRKGQTPKPTATAKPSPTATPKSSPTPTPTPSPSPTATP